MPRGDKSKYTDKQDRKADHIAEGYEKRGVVGRRKPSGAPGRRSTRRAAAATRADPGVASRTPRCRHERAATSAARPRRRVRRRTLGERQEGCRDANEALARVAGAPADRSASARTLVFRGAPEEDRSAAFTCRSSTPKLSSSLMKSGLIASIRAIGSDRVADQFLGRRLLLLADPESACDRLGPARSRRRHPHQPPRSRFFRAGALTEPAARLPVPSTIASDLERNDTKRTLAAAPRLGDGTTAFLWNLA